MTVLFLLWFILLLNQTLMNALKSKPFPLYKYGAINELSTTFTWYPKSVGLPKTNVLLN